jgi:hypothetical protein
MPAASTPAAAADAVHAEVHILVHSQRVGFAGPWAGQLELKGPFSGLLCAVCLH